MYNNKMASIGSTNEEESKKRKKGWYLVDIVSHEEDKNGQITYICVEWKCFTTDIDTYRNDEELKYYSDDIESVISFDNMVHIQWKNSMIPINNLCKAMG
eukprot:162953_1